MDCKCRGVCRCLHKYELCGVVGISNTVNVPCPLDERGCAVESLESSRLEIVCPCCNTILETTNDIFTISNCRPCTVEIDLANITCNNAKCNFRYRIFINDVPYLAGILQLDWSFV